MPASDQEERKQSAKQNSALPRPESEHEDVVKAFRELNTYLRDHQDAKRTAAAVAGMINRSGLRRVLASHGFAGRPDKGRALLAAIVRGLIPLVSKPKIAISGRVGNIEAESEQDRSERAKLFMSQSYQAIVQEFYGLLNDLRTRRKERRADTDRLIAEAEKSRLDAEATIRWSRQMVPPK